MSQTFDVIAKETGPVSIAATFGNDYMNMTRLCFRGPNRFVAPKFSGNPPGIEYSSTEENFKFDTIIGRRDTSEMHHFHISYHDEAVTALHAPIRRFTELSTLGERRSGIVLLTPKSLVNVNHATYFVRLNAKCAKQDLVEVSFDDGGKLAFRGEIELHSYDPKIVRMSVRVPANAKVEASYAQILQVKDSIIAKLSRMQYGQNPL